MKENSSLFVHNLVVKEQYQKLFDVSFPCCDNDNLTSCVLCRGKIDLAVALHEVINCVCADTNFNNFLTLYSSTYLLINLTKQTLLPTSSLFGT